MKKQAVAFLLLFTVLGLAACSKKDDQLGGSGPDNISKQFSYVMGLEIVGTLGKLETVTLDREAFLKGINDALDGNPPMLSPLQMQTVKAIVSEQERALRNKQIMALAEKNLKEQKAFLEQNRKKKGVVVTKSGLQYVVLKKGDGPRPGPTDIVKINMIGKLLDGTVFDSTYQRGGPVWVRVKGTIPAWEEALTLMNVGSKYRFFIPSKLAHGKKGNFMEGGIIGPNAMLIMDIELLEIKKDKSAS